MRVKLDENAEVDKLIGNLADTAVSQTRKKFTMQIGDKGESNVDVFMHEHVGHQARTRTFP